MTSPLTSSVPSPPSISDHESPLQQESQPKLHLLPRQEKVDAHSADDIQNKQSPPSIESTNATIKTDIDLHHETATTTTIVHLPFQLGEQCPPPKVISWMKSHRAARHKTSAQHHHHHKHHRHHPHQRSSLLQHILPFLDAKKKRGFVDKTKKGDQAVTLFSIQVTVLGKVSVPSIPSQDPNNTNDIAPEQDSTRTVPAQLDRSETTSYVIHRTFEDFERLSEMVLRMGHSLHGHDHHSRRHGVQDNQAANISPEVQGKPVTPSSSPTSREGPALTALSVHHPHPGLYQTLLKQYSNVKANQRAFDASSTTHGFNEEGAFERVLELNQYLGNVWYWLLPENHPPHLDLSHERHEIIQWFKPLAQSAHADGRQMRERSPEDEQKRHSILQQYGSMSSIRREPTKDKNIETLTAVTTAETETSSSSLSSSPLSQEAVTSGHTDQSKHNYEETRSLSVLSVPSLSSSSSSCSSSSCSSSSVSSISIPSEENQSGDRRQDDGQGDIKTAHETSQTPSTATSSTLESLDSISEMANEGDKEATIHIPNDQEQNLVSDPSGLQSDVKVKRRMSISHVFRSLTSPRSTHIQRQRQSMYETGNKRMLATSASMPITTGRNSVHHEILPEEIYIWNTVTTKYHAPPVPAAP